MKPVCPVIVQLELRSPEPEQTAKFLHQALGWTEVPIHMHEYIVFQVDHDSPYGVAILRAPMPKAQGNAIVPYFKVANLGQTLERVQSFGGRIYFGPRTIPGYGHMAQAQDPFGLTIGLLEPT